jgi:hypothetical protein
VIWPYFAVGFFYGLLLVTLLLALGRHFARLHYDLL